MKKILLALLLVFLIPLSACEKAKYEFKDGIMYENGKEASGTFELTINGFKSKGKFINGLANGLLEVYYPNGSIMTKTLFSNGVHLKDEVYYRNGKLMLTYLKDKRMDIFYDDGQLVMSFNLQTGKSSSYHENGNPLFVMTRVKSTLYKIDAKGETLTYLYSTGEKLMTSSSVSGDTEIFFKNGQTFFIVNGVNSRFYYKDGKLLYESNNGEWKFFDREGKQIMSNFEEITDIKKID